MRARRVSLVALAAAVLAGPAAASTTTAGETLVIHGDRAIGSFPTIRPTGGTLAAALAAFGPVDSARRDGDVCTTTWRALGLTATFANLGGNDPCAPDTGFFTRALMKGKRWRTAGGLAVGDSLARLQRTAPRARRGSRRGQQTEWSLLRHRVPADLGGGTRATLLARVAHGRIVAFERRTILPALLPALGTSPIQPVGTGSELPQASRPASRTRPTVAISATPSATTTGNVAQISWVTTNKPTSCTASGDWAGRKSTRGGSQTTATLATVGTYVYSLTCSNATGSSSASATVVVTQAAPPPPGAVGPYGEAATLGNWSLRFSDEFEGTSLDLTRWRPNWFGATDASITRPINSYEESCYDPAQVSVGGGTLKLTAIALDGPRAGCVDRAGNSAAYASGMVNTRYDYQFTYGYMESRIWLPPGTASAHNWMAWWANGDGDWPATGEIDVMETLGGVPRWHFHYLGGRGEHAQYGSSGDLVTNPSGWHVFAADWEPGRITFYYDGVNVGSVTENVTSAPMYLILNYGVSSFISPPVTTPSTVEVDYVRHWQK